MVYIFGLLANNLRKSNPKKCHPDASSPNFGVILANGKDLLEDVKKELGF